MFFAIGGALLPGYLLCNALIFGSAVPVSGQAKQLKDGLVPSTRGLEGLLTPSPSRILLEYPAVAATILGIVILGLYSRRIEREKRVVLQTDPGLLGGWRADRDLRGLVVRLGRDTGPDTGIRAVPFRSSGAAPGGLPS